MKEAAVSLLTNVINAIVSPSKEDFNDFFKILSFQQIDKGTKLIEKGTFVDRLHFISEGYIKYEYEDVSKKRVIHMAGNGVFASDFFSYYSSQQAITDVISITPCQLLRVDKIHLEKLYRENNTWANFGRKIAENALVNQIMERIKIQTLSPEERYTNLLVSNPELLKVVKLGDLAEMLGITQETLSRIRKRLSQA
ncbi:MAG: Crp/Fnr family transcriptional regulator [Thermonemataceae bacterium]